MTKLIFREFIKGHPKFLSPVKTLQAAIIKNTLGPKEWNRMVQHRIKLSQAAYMTPHEILQNLTATIGTPEDTTNRRRKSSAAVVNVLTAYGGTDDPLSTHTPISPALPSSMVFHADDQQSVTGTESIATRSSVVRRRQQRHSLDSLSPSVHAVSTAPSTSEISSPPPGDDTGKAGRVSYGCGGNMGNISLILYLCVESATSRKKRRRRNRQTFPVQVQDADAERDKIISDLLPSAQPVLYGSLGHGFCDVKYDRDGFEFDHSHFLSSCGHVNEATKVCVFMLLFEYLMWNNLFVYSCVACI